MRVAHNRLDENEEIGKEYGDLVIIAFKERRSNNRVFIAKCKVCGREREVWLKDVKKLVGTSHKRCSWELPKNDTTKRLRSIWSHMVDRCTNEKTAHYKSYGGRGITCDYKFFVDFYDDFIDSYLAHVQEYGIKDTTIDRINVNGNYTKSNMRWATILGQLQNKRKMIVKATNGEVTIIGSVRDVYTKIPCDKSCIYDCIYGKTKQIKGYTITIIEKPLTTRSKKTVGQG